MKQWYLLLFAVILPLIWPGFSNPDSSSQTVEEVAVNPPLQVARADLLPDYQTADLEIHPDATSLTPNPKFTDLFDPLTYGASLGEVRGGEFTPQGWRVTSPNDFIRYEINTLTEGSAEWENAGLAAENLSPEQFMLFSMWDPTQGPHGTNSNRVQIQKLDSRHDPPFVRLYWNSDGEEQDGGFSFLEWNPDEAYHWRIEWRPEGDFNVVRVFLQGRHIIYLDYRRPYEPATLYLELGSEEGSESIVGAVYRNVLIGPIG
jgi:hypothetical protein